jgi:phosphate:Na+ symporter
MDGGDFGDFIVGQDRVSSADGEIRQMKTYALGIAVAALLAAFWASPTVIEIAAGVAIFLFGMLMLEEGFRQLGGGHLERLLGAATRSTPRALLFGVVSTTLLQSSSLVSVVTISFLSAGLISLLGGIGIVFGANIGTTTGAWIVAGLGLKVNIAAYAMPMIAVSVLLVFQKAPVPRGIGYVLAGIGFLFLGIHYMKIGFEAFRGHIDLEAFALPGLLGLVVYTAIGTLATVIMQSSHATMVLILTALAAGQITYDNAIALAIGANVGTTVTAIIGAIGANFQGRRLALAHLIFNLATAAVALIFVAQLREIVDVLAGWFGIGAEDYALKLAVFHTVFNVLGVALMLPLLNRLVRLLERRIPEPVPDISRPRYLTASADAFPETAETALRNEVLHLYDNATKLILHGLNLHRSDVLGASDIDAVVRASRTPIDLDIGDGYERRVKTLYAAILDFATRARGRDISPKIAARIDALRDIAGALVRSVKSVKHIRKNVARYATRDLGAETDLYDALRADVARIVIAIRDLGLEPSADRSALWLDQEAAEIEAKARARTARVGDLVRSGAVSAGAATSFLNDASYADSAMRELVTAALAYDAPVDDAESEVEQLLALDDEELSEAIGAEGSDGAAAVTPVSQAPARLRVAGRSGTRKWD